jgi:hypothetical protein
MLAETSEYLSVPRYSNNAQNTVIVAFSWAFA